MSNSWQLGVDLGSVNVKVVAIDPQGKQYYWTRPAAGKPLDVLAQLLRTDISETIGTSPICIAVTGIGHSLFTANAKAHTVNEVMATARAAAHLSPGIQTVVDIGGQFSKWILLRGSAPNPHEVRDFATNGLCAAGTGAFLQQQADRLRISIDTLGKMANTATKGSPIAGRCTVFAKSDMIHQQQKGTPTDQIAYGLCLALARTFLTTVMNGRSITLPVLLSGGGAGNPGLVRAFREVLGSDEAVIVPPQPMSLAALGAAIIESTLNTEPIFLQSLISSLTNQQATQIAAEKSALEPLAAPNQKTAVGLKEDPVPAPGLPPAFLGVDVGSVSTNLVLWSPQSEFLQGIYLPTQGQPLDAINLGLAQFHELYGDRLEILGVGVTGSGRHLAAQILSADVVRNEITAQLTSTAYYFPNVDTIFEIGGQDSKYIQAKNARLLDFEMNKICSAGTGSFLEEQANRLGIDINMEFAKHALAGDSPCDLGTRCTVFMDSQLVQALQQGASVDNLCAGLAYSVARNYLDKVVASRPIGKTIVFQGGTASNAAVVAAFSRILKRDVHIHPYNRLSGAIGAAILAMNQMQRTRQKTTFAGFDACNHATLSTFECKGCENRCQVNQVTVSERTVHFGDICERYTEKDRFTRTAVQSTEQSRPFPELFALRNNLLEKIIANASHTEDSKTKIGIPRASIALEFLPLWVVLISELGFEPVVSARTDPARLTDIASTVPADVCLPIKAAAACVDSLIRDQNLPRVFVPSLLQCIPQKDRGEAHTCFYAQHFPDMLRAQYNGKLIHAQFAIGKNPYDDTEGIRALAKAFDKPLPKVLLAMSKARKVYEQFVTDREKLGQNALQSDFDRAVVVLGKPYNTHDAGLNLFLANHLEKLNLPAIPWDCLPLSNVSLSQRWNTLPWHYSRQQLRALEFIRSDPRLFVILISNYGCGPDAFTVKHLEEMLADKPRLFLEFDEHHAEAGLITRLEAFADEIESNITMPTSEYAPTKSTNGTTPTPLGKRIFIPNFSQHVHIFAAAFHAVGLDAHVLPVPDAETMRIGEELSSGRECHPFAIMLGELKRMTQSGKFRTGDVFVSPSGTTPCLVRQYGDALRIHAHRAKLPEIEIWDASTEQVEKMIGKSGFIRFFQGITAVDFLYILATRLRPYELHNGTMDNTFDNAVASIADAVANKQSPVSALQRSVYKLLTVPRDGYPGDRPVIGVTGDLYTRINPLGNMDLFKRLEDMGCEVWPSPFFAANASITAWQGAKQQAGRLHLTDAFKKKIKSEIASTATKRLFQNIDPEIVRLATEQTPAELIGLARPFVSEHTNSPTILGVGKIADFIERGAEGVINAIAVHCMVGISIDSTMPLLRKSYPETPIITLTYGSSQEPGQQIKLETFVQTVLEKAKKPRFSGV